MNTFNHNRMDELATKLESHTATAQEAEEFVHLYRELVAQLESTLSTSQELSE